MPQTTTAVSRLTPGLLDELRAKLRAVADEYESRLSDTPDIDDISQAVYGRALQEARDALDRMDDGTYGFCETCGEPIATERLLALPHTVTCTACASRS